MTQDQRSDRKSVPRSGDVYLRRLASECLELVEPYDELDLENTIVSRCAVALEAAANVVEAAQFLRGGQPYYAGLLRKALAQLDALGQMKR